ncbi:MAG: hypothetical protein D6701_03090, partial [Gemmatimonadetes bacterium]
LRGALEARRARGVPGAARFTVAADPGPAGGYTVLDGALRVAADADPSRARAVCWLAHSVRRFHERLTRPGRLQSELELRERVERWNTFNERGLTPYPWELLLNEFVGWLGTRSPLEPPMAQLVALRPSPAVEVDSSLEDRRNVAAIEVLGAVFYVSKRRWYLGASFLWTSPSESNAGIGAMIHVMPWLQGGPVWRDVDGDGDRDFRLTLSFDAFDLLKSAPGSLIEAAKQATEGRAGGGN